MCYQFLILFYSHFQSCSKDEAIQMALKAFTSVLSTDLKPHEMEVGVVTKDDPTFTILTEDEIDAQLTLINERE